jgi:hypothetical protein
MEVDRLFFYWIQYEAQFFFQFLDTPLIWKWIVFFFTGSSMRHCKFWSPDTKTTL